LDCRRGIKASLEEAAGVGPVNVMLRDLRMHVWAARRRSVRCEGTVTFTNVSSLPGAPCHSAVVGEPQTLSLCVGHRPMRGARGGAAPAISLADMRLVVCCQGGERSMLAHVG